MSNIKHHTNTMIRMIYISLIFFVFKIFLGYTGLSINKSAYIIFFLIMMFEYLGNNLNFKKRESFTQCSIYSFMINSMFFLVYWSFTRNIKIIYMIITLTLTQILIREILIKFFIRERTILVVGKEKELEHVKKILSEQYNKIKLKTAEKIEEIQKMTIEEDIEQIIFFQYPEDKKKSETIIKLKIEGIKFIEYLKFMEKYEGKVAVKEINNNWIISSEGFNILYDSFQKRIKRLFDIILALLIAILTIPLMLLVYIIIRIEIPKVNPLYSQIRIGLGGSSFKMYKFRSMKPHSPDLSLEEKTKYVTKFGNFIRKTRIDELPQIINVLKGELSFIGPRAEWDRLHEEYAANIPYYYLRQTVKPGLTGWAQVMHTHGEGIEHSLEKFEYDLYYIKYQNLVLDIIIFFKTIKTVIFRKGK